MSSKVVELARKARKAPPGAVARELGRRVASFGTAWAQRERDHLTTTYSKPGPFSLAGILPRLELEWSGAAGDTLAGVCRHYVDHRFDLLGSGWTQVAYGRAYPGLAGIRFAPGSPVVADEAGSWLEGRVNASNLARAQSIWALVSEHYRPIDWHVDFKSGYRWPSTAWYRDVSYGNVVGADVKVPWELARAQHLPRLALAYGAASRGDPRFLPAEHYAREVRDQILDFIAANPPRYGVNWACTMDVAIRVANWLLAFDILHSYGVELDVAFVTVLAGSVADHASFITSNLEWHPVFRSNHYLADICGLAFAAAYLRDHRGGRRPEKAERWLAMASRELAAETAAQFGPDGGNKEASICYHRLSTEMVIYTTALISTCGASSEWTKGQLGTIERALGFTAWAMKDSGQVPQIGDNDSGRFFMLAPAPTPVSVPEARTRWANLVDYTELEDNEQYWAQDSLDHAHLLAAGGALISSGRRIPLSAPLAAELALWSGTGDVPGALAEIARSRWRGSSMPVVGTTTPPPGLTITPPYDPDLARLQDAGTHDVVRWRVKPGGASLADNLEAAAFPDFGLYILRSPRLYLAFRCGPVGQSGAGGHSHNDQLGLEIEIDGCPWARDPGSYLYTPLPAARNAYRSARAHFVPRQGTEEPGDLEAGLFLLPERAHARCLRFTPGGITGVHYGYGLPTVREVHVTHAFIDVDDTIPKIEETAGPVLVGRATLESPGQLAAFAAAALAFSPSYGVLEIPHD